MKSLSKDELRNYRLVKFWFLATFPKCARCAKPAKEIDHIKGRKGHEGKLPLLVAPRNFQGMCDRKDPNSLKCHIKKTKSGNPIDWRSEEQKAVTILFQSRIENYLPERKGPWPAGAPEIFEAVKMAIKEFQST